jgi:hypothetical protein
MRVSTGKGNNLTRLRPVASYGSPERSVTPVQRESLITISRGTLRAPSQLHSDKPSLQLAPDQVVVEEGFSSVSRRYQRHRTGSLGRS